MIRQQDGYVLEYIKEQIYLLPYGQKIADLKKGVQINETGAFLWNLLKTPSDKEQLTKALLSYYELPDTEHDALYDDVSAFTENLLQQGLLTEDVSVVLPNANQTFLRIAEHTLCIFAPSHIFCDKWLPFIIKEQTPSSLTSDMCIQVLPTPPTHHPNGVILVRNKELLLFECEDRFVLCFPTLSAISEVHMTKNGKNVSVYCNAISDETIAEQFFFAIRPCFLYRIQKDNFFAIHSASILYKNQAWLFSGHSGMGKSTHTALWHTLFDVPYLNGDLNVIGWKHGEPVVYGIPWCGTSNIFTVKQYPLGGIVLLGRSKKDHLVDLAPHEKILQVMQRMISPSWTAPLLACNLQASETLAHQIPIFHLRCTKENSAAIFMKEQIDIL